MTVPSPVTASLTVTVTPLGEGEVDLRGIVEVLRDADYGGPYILRRTDTANPAADLSRDRDALSRLLRA